MSDDEGGLEEGGVMSPGSLGSPGSPRSARSPGAGDDGAWEGPSKAQEEFLELLNLERERVGAGRLALDAAFCRVAQARANVLLAAKWQGGKGKTSSTGLGPHRRYFEANGGTWACVSERALLLPSAGKDYEAGNVRRSLARVRDRLLRPGSELAFALGAGLSLAGFGFAVTEESLYIVCAVAHQLAQLDPLESLDFRAPQTIKGRMLGGGGGGGSGAAATAASLMAGYTPVGAVVHFFSEEEESAGAIPANYLQPERRNKRAKKKALGEDAAEESESESDEEDDAKAARQPVDTLADCTTGTALCTIPPWEFEFDSRTGCFQFDINLPAALQRAGLYEVPRGVFHVEVFVQRATKQHPLPQAEERGYLLPHPARHAAACAASFSYPPRAGSAAAAAELELARARRRRLVKLPVQQVQLLVRRERLPPGFEVGAAGAERQEDLPLLVLAKSEQVNMAVVELAVAFGTDDVPPGFDVVCAAKDGKPVSLRLAKRDEGEGGAGASAGTGVDEDQPEGGKEEEEEEEEDEPIYLCVRLSDDPVEIAARGISDILLRLDSEEREQAHYTKLDILPGALHAIYRVVGAGAGDLEAEDAAADRAAAAGAGGRDADASDEDEEDARLDAEWGELEDLGQDSLGAMNGGELGECILPTAESKRAELEEAERAAQASRIESLLEAARAEREKLLQDNMALQKALVPFMAKKKQTQQAAAAAAASPTVGDDDAQPGMQQQLVEDDALVIDSAVTQEKERQYATSLAACNDAQETLRRTRESYDKVAMELQTRLDEKEAKASEIRQSFAHFKREIAKAAENSRTGKPIPMRIIRQFEETELAKDDEVEKVRLKNINLRAQLRKLESALHEKEKLAEGLHLIDFEQLKIENQTLNEKIEERNEELHKLRKKTTTTVQVLTHIKEKTQFVQGEAVALKQELAALDKEVTASRDQLTKCKHTRDGLRSANDSRKRDQGFVNSSLLVQDFQGRKDEIKALKRTIRDLQQKYSNLTGLQLVEDGATLDKAASRQEPEHKSRNE